MFPLNGCWRLFWSVVSSSGSSVISDETGHLLFCCVVLAWYFNCQNIFFPLFGGQRLSHRLRMEFGGGAKADQAIWTHFWHGRNDGLPTSGVRLSESRVTTFTGPCFFFFFLTACVRACVCAAWQTRPAKNIFRNAMLAARWLVTAAWKGPLAFSSGLLGGTKLVCFA